MINQVRGNEIKSTNKHETFLTQEMKVKTKNVVI